MGSQRTILITGASSGLGFAVARAAVASGHLVIGTIRREADRHLLENLHPDRAKAVILDVTEFDRVDLVISDVVRQHGPVDVLINSAGYGHEGVLEESPLEELRRQLDTNVLGAVAVTKAVLSGMRARRRGHIVNITSMAGQVGLPGIAYYTASKYALEGISEVLAKELSGLGVKVTALAPGSFRTDWAGRSMIRSERSISDYDAVFDPVREARRKKHGAQIGNPDRAARVILDLIEMDDPPIHLLLGSDALSLVRPALESRLNEMRKWQSTAKSTDFA